MSEIDKYDIGEVSERLVEYYLQRKGWYTSPARTRRTALNSAPLLVRGTEALIQPDIYACKNGKAIRAEVKQKSEAHWVRKRSQKEHGVPEKQLQHYQEVASMSGHHVHLFVFELSQMKLLHLDLNEHEPYPPLSPKSSKKNTGDVLRNFSRDWFHELKLADQDYMKLARILGALSVKQDRLSE